MKCIQNRWSCCLSLLKMVLIDSELLKLSQNGHDPLLKESIDPSRKWPTKHDIDSKWLRMTLVPIRGSAKGSLAKGVIRGKGEDPTNKSLKSHGLVTFLSHLRVTCFPASPLRQVPDACYVRLVGSLVGMFSVLDLVDVCMYVCMYILYICIYIYIYTYIYIYNTRFFMY